MSLRLSLLEQSLLIIGLAHPLVEAIARRDRDLASQARRALIGIALNAAEGSGNHAQQKLAGKLDQSVGHRPTIVSCEKKAACLWKEETTEKPRGPSPMKKQSRWSRHTLAVPFLVFACSSGDSQDADGSGSSATTSGGVGGQPEVTVDFGNREGSGGVGLTSARDHSTGEASSGNVTTGSISSGGAPTEHLSTGGTSSEGASTSGLSTGGASTGGLSTGGTSTSGFSTGGTSTSGLSTGGASTGGVSSNGSGADGTAADGVSTGGRSNGGTNGGGTTGGAPTGGFAGDDGAGSGGRQSGAGNGGMGSAGTTESGSGGTSEGGSGSASGQAGSDGTGGGATCSGPTPGTQSHNPLFSDTYTADPAVMVHDCTFYITAGHDDGDAGFVMREWYVLKSSDMVNWTRTVALDLSAFSWATANAWAGQMIARGGRFYWYVPVADRNGAMALGVAVGDSPEGPFENAIGAPLIDDAFEMENFGYADPAETVYTIDPTVFIDDDGQAYLAYGGFWRMVTARLGDDMISIDGSMVESTPPNYFESPYLVKHNGNYYHFYSAGSGNPTTIDYASSNSPMGPWTRRGTVVPTLPNVAGQDAATNHAGVGQLGNAWFIAYHLSNGPNNGGTYRREVAVERLVWTGDTVDPVTPSSGISF